MADKVTRKDLFARIADVMSDDAEVVEMCEKYIEQLSKKREYKVKQEVLDFAEMVHGKLAEVGEVITAKELTDKINDAIEDVEEKFSTAKVAAALRRLSMDGRVETHIDPEKPRNANKYRAA